METEKIVFDAAVGGGNKIIGFIDPADPACGTVKGVIQICHGMTDHYGRYREMADSLRRVGWHVCGMDMLGHGQTWKENIGNDMPKGFFGSSRDSAMCILRDEMEFHRIVKERFGDMRYVLYGHSMGSFIARNIFITPEYASEFDRFIFASTMGPNPSVGFGIFLSKAIGAFGLKRRPGKLLNRIAFATYNRRIRHPKTNFDWLSTDDEEVRRYSEDEMAGFLFTCKGFTDLFILIDRMQKKSAYKSSAARPVFLPYGSEDPVGDYGKGIRKVADSFRSAGVEVKVKDYGPYRHELQHEPVRKEYFEDIDLFASGRYKENQDDFRV